MTAWTITWWTRDEVERASLALILAMKPWLAEWGLGEECVGVAGAAESPAGDWHCIAGQDDADGVWMSYPQRVERDLLRIWDDGIRNSPPLLAQAAKAALAALPPALRQAFGWPQASRAELGPQGLLTLEISLGHGRIWLALSAGVARGLAERKAPALPALSALQPAIAHRQLTLTAILDPVALDIGGLCSLIPGDVVMLEHRLDRAVTLQDTKAAPVATAHLVRQGGRKAIQLEGAV